MHDDPHSRRRFTGFGAWELFILGLSLLTLGGMLYDVIVPPPPGKQSVFQHLDGGICLFFLADFVLNLVRRKDRLAYLRWGWIDLLSSIPVANSLRWGRLVYVVRMALILRGAKSVQKVATAVFHDRKTGTLSTAGLALIAVLLTGAVVALHFERDDPQATIRSGDDALWWAAVTITTVGYGDYVPVTMGGRFAGALLMTSGVGLFAVFSGYLASWLVEGTPRNRLDNTKLAKIEKDLAAIKKALEIQSPDRPA